jgi:hypothetical protein
MALTIMMKKPNDNEHGINNNDDENPMIINMA